MTTTVQPVTLTQAQEFYPDLFYRIFGFHDPVHAPGVVYVATRDEAPIGLLAGYVHNLETFYIQYAGVLPQTSHQAMWRCLLSVLQQVPTQYAYLLTMIEHTNAAALRLALKAGFRIVGTRTYPDGIVMVELLQRRDYGLS